MSVRALSCKSLDPDLLWAVDLCQNERLPMTMYYLGCNGWYTESAGFWQICSPKRISRGAALGGEAVGDVDGGEMDGALLRVEPSGKNSPPQLSGNSKYYLN